MEVTSLKFPSKEKKLKENLALKNIFIYIYNSIVIMGVGEFEVWMFSLETTRGAS